MSAELEMAEGRTRRPSFRTPVIPRWLLQVNPRSTVGSKEVAQIFGFGPNSVYAEIRGGQFPPPDLTTSRGSGKPRGLHWYVRTVLLEAKRRMRANSELHEPQKGRLSFPKGEGSE